jgi:hypothetical protein
MAGLSVRSSSAIGGIFSQSVARVHAFREGNRQMTSIIVIVCSAALAGLFYRSGYRNGYDAGITAAGKLTYGVDGSLRGKLGARPFK